METNHTVGEVRRVESLVVVELENRVSPCVPPGLVEPVAAVLAHLPQDVLTIAGPPCSY